MEFLNDIARRHNDWVERMGWHNKTTLESLALIGSEIGEAFGECLGKPLGDEFGEELADIVLRIADLSVVEGLDLAAEVERELQREPLTWHGTSAVYGLAAITVDFATWTNTARAAQLGPDFAQGLARVTARVLALAAANGFDLREHLERKLLKNEARGTRGRRV